MDTELTHLSLTQSTPEYAQAEYDAYGPESVIAISLADLSFIISQSAFTYYPSTGDAIDDTERDAEFGIATAMAVIEFLTTEQPQ